jgi:hypothetical protein
MMIGPVRGAGLAMMLLVVAAGAQAPAPANSLREVEDQFSSCMAAKAPIPAGPEITIMFAVRRDGSAFGRRRVTYSRLTGDADERQRFVAEIDKAIDACLPLRVTPALGGAIAGRLFTITLGAPKA